MKRIIILTSIVLLLANLLIGAILSAYGGCNLALSSAVIVGNAILLLLADTIRLKDGYKISIMLLFVLAGIIEFVLSLIAPNRFEDNWWLIAVVGLIAVEAILLIITNTVSRKIE